MESCPECGTLMSNLDAEGPVHEYLSAPAGCWKIFSDVMAKEYSDREYWRVHRLTVDAYAAQHASGDDPRQIQSVAVHLLALHLTLDKKLEEAHVRGTMEAVIQKYKNRFPVLEKPPLIGILNIGDIAGAKNAFEHQRIVFEWANQVWSAWRPAHGLIHSLVQGEI
jgi:hypothetical protein